jgi:hypothetical protein
MKKYLFSIIFLLVSYVGFSQKGLSYQAVILDPNAIEVPGQDISGQPFVNGDVWMKFSIYNLIVEVLGDATPPFKRGQGGFFKY